MLGIDAKEKARKLEEILTHLQTETPADDWDLMSSFTRVVFEALPPWMVQGMEAPVLADRVSDNFQFFVRELPPPTQLYRGLPGLHVVARHSTEAESLHATPGKAIPMDTTIVETHTPDAPFIFDSLQNYFRKAGLRVFSAIHPILTVRRQWERIVWIGDAHAEGDKELLCRFRIEHIESKERLRRVEHEIFCVLKCVFLALEDFSNMTTTVQEASRRLRSPIGREDDLESSRDFVQWLAEENFILMGVARYCIHENGTPERVPESVLGVFRDPPLLPVVFPGLVEEVEAQLVPAEGDRGIIDIDYCSNASAIYHLEPIDDIVIRHWGEDRRLEEATFVLGRFSQGSFTEKAAGVPLLREKQHWLIEQTGASPMSHAFRQIRALFNRFPRRELFYAPVVELKPFIERIIQMTGDDEIAIHHRRGRGYVALYVGFSKLRYSYQFEKSLRRTLTEKFGPISFTASEDAASIQVLIFYFDQHNLERPIDEEEVREITEELITTWEDAVSIALTEAFGEREGRRLFFRWISPETRSGIYREATPPEEVPSDVEYLEALEARLEVAVVPRSAEHATLKLYSPRPLVFTEILTTLKNLGLRVTGELHIPIRLPSGHRGHLHRYEIQDTEANVEALKRGARRLAETLRAIDEERATDGSLNTLVLTADLDWREVEVLRTLRNHLQQIRPHYNIETVNGVLLQNQKVARALFRAFEARFDPSLDANRDKVVRRVEAELQQALDEVRSLVEDEILRAFANLIESTVRTNFYQRPQRSVVALKVESAKVEGMPSPRPLFEIYVHSRRLEGVHLRGGRVARGGLRWSDRHDDFRTEILDLMKTQMVKNSIIVPVGSKGGFVLKGTLPQRPALGTYLQERYREFISGLLDVTDNMVGGRVVHPPEVVRHDEDDAYLVVAADKGTAHLSDTANEVAKHYGFWLKDAFASGGSVGYDHKKVGITARGAWECVRHHFHNLGVDVMKEPFTVVGIGDMGGDVFGNGMLRSRTTKLVAAFNHVHIFVDPDPDPERSFQERERLFRLPRATWRDYDTTIISKGGGVFDRSAKRILLTPEMQRVLGVDQASMSGEEVIRTVLKAPVDLLYNGGIGTYVKASSEEHVEVGDRANDRVRIDGRDIRARVVAEGGNLGLTQKARLEYWAKGGLINTDAVDNSGGVDMSDHEVNIKIQMDLLLKKGAIASGRERNRIFMDMTEDVASLVLYDNASQALALSLDAVRSAERYDDHVRLLFDLVSNGIMNRKDEDIPSRKELLESPNRDRGLPRPLLALVLGYVKIWAYSEVLETDFPDSSVGAPFLESYFPEKLRPFADTFPEHPLRREIIATAAVNHVVNHAGVDFLARMAAIAKADLGKILAAYLESSREMDAARAREEILSSGKDAATTHRSLVDFEARLDTATRAALEGKAAVKPSKRAAAVAGSKKA